MKRLSMHFTDRRINVLLYSKLTEKKMQFSLCSNKVFDKASSIAEGDKILVVRESVMSLYETFCTTVLSVVGFHVAWTACAVRFDIIIIVVSIVTDAFILVVQM